MGEKVIFKLKGAFGDILSVYDDRVIITHNKAMNFFDYETKKDKTIYYSDILYIQYKMTDFVGGYIRFVLLDVYENRNNMLISDDNENTILLPKTGEITFNSQNVVEYMREKLKEVENIRNRNNIFSTADEIRKYKELLDNGAITQEEYDIKKKQLLNL